MSHAERGGGQHFEVVLTRDIEVLAIVKGGAKSFHPLKGGGVKGFTLSEWGGGHNKFWTRDFPILYPLRIINDRSLKVEGRL